jgi:hypothetical protein
MGFVPINCRPAIWRGRINHGGADFGAAELGGTGGEFEG